MGTTSYMVLAPFMISFQRQSAFLTLSASFYDAWRLFCVDYAAFINDYLYI
jgi:hypothetical protein